MYYIRSRSSGQSLKGQGHNVKKSSVLLSIAESNGDVRIILIGSWDIAVYAHVQYKFGQNKTAYKDWRDVGRPSSCNAFATAAFATKTYCDSYYSCHALTNDIA